MKRNRTTIEQIAEWSNLCWAAERAAKGKRDRQQVAAFFSRLERNIDEIRSGLLEGSLPLGVVTQFRIFDPKPRQIHAPIFRERVVHHALMRQIGPVLDRSLVDDSFACRVGKGTITAVHRAQQHSRRFPWYAKIDVQQYFPSIDHVTLNRLLAAKFKDHGLLELLRRIIASHEAAPGRGMPIGALTSQHFANFYLNDLDRFLLNHAAIRGVVRYMDDTVYWCDSKAAAKSVLSTVRDFLASRLRLDLHDRVQVNRSSLGLSICGFRVLPGRIRLTQRRRRLYAAARARWERRFEEGTIDAQKLQSGYAAALGMTLHADSQAWRRNQLARKPALEACQWA